MCDLISSVKLWVDGFYYEERKQSHFLFVYVINTTVISSYAQTKTTSVQLCILRYSNFSILSPQEKPSGKEILSEGLLEETLEYVISQKIGVKGCFKGIQFWIINYILIFFRRKYSGAGDGTHNERKHQHKNGGIPNQYSPAQNVNNSPFRVGGAWQSSPAAATVNHCHRVQSYPGEDVTGGMLKI